jgi:hypothetical protein
MVTSIHGYRIPVPSRLRPEALPLARLDVFRKIISSKCAIQSRPTRCDRNKQRLNKGRAKPTSAEVKREYP